MGQIHNELRRSKLSDALTRALGAMKGAVGIERFGETLTPVVDLWSLPEWSALRDEKLGVIRTFLAALAGNFGFVFLVNPANSNRIITVERVGTITAVAGSTFLEYATEAQVTAGLAAAAQTVGTSRDRRLGTDTVAQTISGYNAAQTVGGRQIDQATSGTADPVLYKMGLPYIIRPGEAIGTTGRVVNESVIGLFTWRERQALPGELL